MIAATKPMNKAELGIVDVYLGFEIRQESDNCFVAIPTGWTHRDAALLEAHDLPSLRKMIWGWWHRLLD
jgi:hypothetical protein